MGDPEPEIIATLRALAVADGAAIDGLLGPSSENLEESGLDARTHALVRFAALVALGAPGESFRREVERAVNRGASMDDLLGALIAAAPQVGAPRLIWASRELLEALGTATPGLCRDG